MSGGFGRTGRTPALVLLVLVCAPLLAAPQCGADIEDGQLGEPCTRTADCVEGLRCLAGSCQRADDAGADSGAAPDAGTDGAADSGADAAPDSGADAAPDSGAATDAATDAG